MEIQIRDPVHNFIKLHAKEAELLGTQPLQRLRGIRQLALASLVYPGAIHTRFDHTLGVTHVAGKMAEALDLPDEEISLIRLAALLHDIGHGPFSHVSEYALEQYADRSSLDSVQQKEKIHELVTSLIIQRHPEIVRLLGQSDCEKVVNLLGKGFGDPVNHSVVSGPLDADKQDYLLRDSYFCGVKYGVFDLHQLHRSFVVYNGYLMLKPDGVHAAEQYMLAKYYLTTNVYRHKVRLISDQMIVRAIVLGIDVDDIPDLRTLFSFDNSDKFTDNYLQWDDARFFHEFGRSDEFSDTKCQQLLRRLEERKLLKRVFQAKPSDFSPETRDRLQSIGKKELKEIKRSLEHAVADCLSVISGQKIDADFVILHTFDVKSVKEMSRNDGSDILIAERPEPIPFDEKSSLFASINEGLKEEFVEVYAPVMWSTRKERQNILDNARESIINTIEDIFRNGRGAKT